MPDAIDVLPLPTAKQHLNIRTENTVEDLELIEMIGAAVERVERHTGPGVLAAPAAGLQLLAVKAVLAVYWRTQRVRRTGGAGQGGASGAAIELDNAPGGAAPIRAILTDLLGPPVEGGVDDDTPSPLGSFPLPLPYPDPAFAPVLVRPRRGAEC